MRINSKPSTYYTPFMIPSRPLSIYSPYIHSNVDRLWSGPPSRRPCLICDLQNDSNREPSAHAEKLKQEYRKETFQSFKSQSQINIEHKGLKHIFNKWQLIIAIFVRALSPVSLKRAANLWSPVQYIYFKNGPLDDPVVSRADTWP